MMKKIILALVIICVNITLIGCTDDSLVDAQKDQSQPHYADDTEGGHIDPPADPPGDGN